METWYLFLFYTSYSSMISFITSNLLWTEGWPIVLVLALIAGFGLWRFRWLVLVALFALMASLYFFRNPDRVCLEALHDNTVIISPADGTVVAIDDVRNGTLPGYVQRLSIFLSPLDVHVNWTPIAGTIESIVYTPGSFMPAFLPKSSELNEHNDVHIVKDSEHHLIVRQIAGTVARRIACWVKDGEVVQANQKYGMIRFGSRVDVYLPDNADFVVALGERVYGGQTVIGHWQQ